MGERGDEDRPVGTPLVTYERLGGIALEDYPDLVTDAVVERDPGDAPRNLRLFFINDGFLDIWLSAGRYSYHWQTPTDVVRFDNAPHHASVETHPHHRHEDDAIHPSTLHGNPEDDIHRVIEHLDKEGYVHR